MKLNFLKKTAEIKNNEVMVNAAFVEGIKSTLKEDSTSVDLSIMNKNNMLGLKVKYLMQANSHECLNPVLILIS